MNYMEVAGRVLLGAASVVKWSHDCMSLVYQRRTEMRVAHRKYS